jgi:hypothetical protein
VRLVLYGTCCRCGAAAKRPISLLVLIGVCQDARCSGLALQALRRESTTPGAQPSTISLGAAPPEFPIHDGAAGYHRLQLMVAENGQSHFANHFKPRWPVECISTGQRRGGPRGGVGHACYSNLERRLIVRPNRELRRRAAHEFEC